VSPDGARSLTGHAPRDRSPAVVALSNAGFYTIMTIIGGTYVVLILLLVIADVSFLAKSTGGGNGAGGVVGALTAALAKPEIRYAVALSLIACTISAILSVIVAVPAAYLLARVRFPGSGLIDAVLDIPIVLPPLVVGLSLLILFQFAPLATPLGRWLPVPEAWADASLSRLVVYQVPAVVLAQFMVAAAFAVRTLRATFNQIDPRCEQVALTLGSTRAQAFSRVVLPEARRGMVTAWTLAWARSLGEFGPLLIFAGATRNKTEVLSTTVFLELSIGDIEAAVAVSLIMIVAAVVVLLIARMWGSHDLSI
jgi:molybdate transport system permease protein